MRWQTITSTQSDEQWFKDYLEIALSSQPTSPPPSEEKLGATTVGWFETEPGIAFIYTNGGTPDDRVLAEAVFRNRLAQHGIKQAEYTFDWDKEDPFRKTAEWDDIESKAVRLVQGNQVQILRNGAQNIVGQVQGDHGSYQTEIMRQDPNSRAITQWSCECPWDQYAFQRTRQWKKYEGRPCSHVLATFWKAQSTPLDEAMDPAAQGQQQMGLGQPNAPQSMGVQWNAPAFGQGFGQGTPIPRGPNQMPAPPEMQQQMMIPGMGMGPTGMPMATGTPPVPADAGVIPPFPMAPPDPATMPNPASVPGLRQPSPTNPVQYPGGTFSKVATELQNGMIVATKYEDWGTWQGRSGEHGAGEPAKIPQGSVGEVLGTDPTTGMVQVLFMNPAIGVQEHGKMEPWGATAWFLPSEIYERPGINPPGPAVKRQR
jgi:hypothetical protein